MTKRDELVEKMHRLADMGRELADEHAKIVEEFLRIQKQIKELDRNAHIGLAFED